MSAKIGALKFVGNEDELVRIKDIPDESQLGPGDEMVLCFGEDPKTWDAIVALIDYGNNGYCDVSIIDVNAKKGIRKPKNNTELVEKRKLFVPKTFLKQEEKNVNCNI